MSSKNIEEEKREEEKEEAPKSYIRWADRNAKLFSLSNVAKFLLVLGVCLLTYIVAAVYLPPLQSVVVALGAAYLALCAVSTRAAAPFLRLLSRGKWPSKDRFSLVDPLQDVSFFFMEGEDSVLIMRDSYKVAAYAMMKVEEIPLSIRGSFNNFFRTLYLQKIPVVYFVEGSPVSERTVSFLPNLEDTSRRYIQKLDKSRRKTFIWGGGGVWTARIVLGTKKEAIAPLRLDQSLVELVEEVKRNALSLAAAFENSYPHCRIEPLLGEALLEATKVMLTGGGVPHFF
nr:hypothetical protein [Candidatus Freyarchaeota archaeon]